MLDMTLEELATDEQREGAMFDLARRIIKRGITDDNRVVERARETILEMTNDRQAEALPDIPEQPIEIGEVEGYGDSQEP